MYSTCTCTVQVHLLVVIFTSCGHRILYQNSSCLSRTAKMAKRSCCLVSGVVTHSVMVSMVTLSLSQQVMSVPMSSRLTTTDTKWKELKSNYTWISYWDASLCQLVSVWLWRRQANSSTDTHDIVCTVHAMYTCTYQCCLVGLFQLGR